MSTSVFLPGGYRYVPGVAQYSAGVAAEPGYEIHRVVFARPVELRAGFNQIQMHLDSLSRPITAFCACELRSPEPFTEEGFREFNQRYIQQLEGWGIVRDGINPIARSNVCPEVDPPRQPSLYAFSYTMPINSRTVPPSFVIAGSGEAPEGHATYEEVTVAFGDLSLPGLRAKMQFVIGEMGRRMNLLGFDWQAVTATQIYTVHNFHALVLEQFSGLKTLGHGLAWHLNRPPVRHLEYEMDCRAVYHERVLPPI